MTGDLSEHNKDAIEYFLRRGENPKYINKITDLPVDVIINYARRLSIDIKKNNDLRTRALEKWSEYRLTNRLNKYDYNNYHYIFIRNAFIDGYMMSHW